MPRSLRGETSGGSPYFKEYHTSTTGTWPAAGPEQRKLLGEKLTVIVCIGGPAVPLTPELPLRPSALALAGRGRGRARLSNKNKLDKMGPDPGAPETSKDTLTPRQAASLTFETLALKLCALKS